MKIAYFIREIESGNELQTVKTIRIECAEAVETFFHEAIIKRPENFYKIFMVAENEMFKHPYFIEICKVRIAPKSKCLIDIFEFDNKTSKENEHLNEFIRLGLIRVIGNYIPGNSNLNLEKAYVISEPSEAKDSSSTEDNFATDNRICLN